jgi:hypothetical protein
MSKTLLRVTTLLLVAVFFLPAAAGGANMPLPAAEATSSIDARNLRRHLSFLASEELGGRYTLSNSNLIAARYLASQLEYLGYRGAARDGSYFQKVPLFQTRVDVAGSRLGISVDGKVTEFKYGDHFLAQNAVSVNVSGALVFVGYGISSPKNGWDDYSKVDVTGKIVVVASGIPKSLEHLQIADDERGIGAAQSHGALAEVAIAPRNLLAAWDQIKASLQRDEQLGLPARNSGAARPFPAFFAGPELINALAHIMDKEEAYLHGGGKALEPSAVPASADLKVAVETKSAGPAQNVAGILEGADPKLKDEFVVFSAHYDHLKTSETGEVFKGADDDGSGTVSVLEIARAFTIGERPKRSILIIFHTGEELGLFGSVYNTDYEPLVPLEKLVADFNIDMVGRSRADDDKDPRDAKLADKNSLYIIGADKLSTELNKISIQTDADTERLRFDYTYNNDSDPERFYYRSDHFNYAKHGIPIIFYFTGVHRDYHRPTDSIEKIDFEKMVRIDRMIFATGWRVANLDHRVVVDKKPAGAN